MRLILIFFYFAKKAAETHTAVKNPLKLTLKQRRMLANVGNETCGSLVPWFRRYARRQTDKHTTIGNETVPIQLAQCRIPGLAIFNAKI